MKASGRDERAAADCMAREQSGIEAATSAPQVALWTARALLHTGAYNQFKGPHRRCLEEKLGGAVPRRAPRRRNEKRRTARAWLQERIRELEASWLPRTGLLFQNIVVLGDALGLTNAERDILAVLASATADRTLAMCMREALFDPERAVPDVLRDILDVDTRVLAEALDQNGTLRECGLVQLIEEPADLARFMADERILEGNSCRLEIMPELAKALLRPHRDAPSLLACFFEPAKPTALTPDDFAHVASDFALLVRILEGALRARATGVNVLLHGAPGVGKTALAETLAAACGARGFLVDVEDRDCGFPIDGNRRFMRYQVSQRILARGRGSVVIFDEAEDVFAREEPTFLPEVKSGHHKGWTNRALERNAVPTIWISNSIDRIDPAFVRRFRYVLEMRTPPPATRRSMLASKLAGVPVRSEWLARRALDDRLTPADVDQAASTVRLVGWASEEDAEESLGRILDAAACSRATSTTARPRFADTLKFDPTLLNVDQDLERLVAGLRARPSGSILLQGPPGTGKTAFVAHLCEAIGKPMFLRRASDLLSMFVGETEKEIAAAFRDASTAGGVLFLDEADSFLRDRARAHQSWEVTAVNELLVQMEAFDGVFVCATNRIDDLDHASMRRFGLKVTFRASTPEQRWRLFLRTLEELGGDGARDSVPTETRAALDRLDGLCPGDFVAVVRQARMTNAPGDSAWLIDALTKELRARPGFGRPPIRLGP